MYVNASLIHELRMLAQHVFRREPNSIFRSRETSALLCVGCIRMKKLIPNKAVAIAGGNSVCREHIV